MFKLRCELFEYNKEDFDTGIAVLDDINDGDSAESLPVEAQNNDFEDVGDMIIDFTESNPFGDPT